MKQNYYKENKTYGSQLIKDDKISARERNVLSRISLLKKSGIVSPASLLEVGSHEGLFLRAVKSLGFEVLGIEPNVYTVNYAKENGLPIISGTFEEAFEEIKNKKFDIVALFHTIEHMPDYFANLGKIKMIMKTGGYLAIEVPNKESYRSKKYGDDWAYVYEEHLHHFSPNSLVAELKKLDFDLKKKYLRDFDEMHMSIKQSLDRLIPFKFKNTNIKYRIDKKEAPAETIKEKNNYKRIFSNTCLLPLRFFLAFLVKILGRGDFMFIVAKAK